MHHRQVQIINITSAYCLFLLILLLMIMNEQKDLTQIYQNIKQVYMKNILELQKFFIRGTYSDMNESSQTLKIDSNILQNLTYSTSFLMYDFLCLDNFFSAWWLVKTHTLQKVQCHGFFDYLSLHTIIIHPSNLTGSSSFYLSLLCFPTPPVPLYMSSSFNNLF